MYFVIQVRDPRRRYSAMPANRVKYPTLDIYRPPSEYEVPHLLSPTSHLSNPLIARLLILIKTLRTLQKLHGLIRLITYLHKTTEKLISQLLYFSMTDALGDAHTLPNTQSLIDPHTYCNKPLRPPLHSSTLP